MHREIFSDEWEKIARRHGENALAYAVAPSLGGMVDEIMDAIRESHGLPPVRRYETSPGRGYSPSHDRRSYATSTEAEIEIKGHA